MGSGSEIRNSSHKRAKGARDRVTGNPKGKRQKQSALPGQELKMPPGFDERTAQLDETAGKPGVCVDAFGRRKECKKCQRPEPSHKKGHLKFCYRSNDFNKDAAEIEASRKAARDLKAIRANAKVPTNLTQKDTDNFLQPKKGKGTDRNQPPSPPQDSRSPTVSKTNPFDEAVAAAIAPVNPQTRKK